MGGQGHEGHVTFLDEVDRPFVFSLSSSHFSLGDHTMQMVLYALAVLT